MTYLGTSNRQIPSVNYEEDLKKLDSNNLTNNAELIRRPSKTVELPIDNSSDAALFPQNSSSPQALLNKSKQFIIIYYDENNVKRNYYFSLLPAIENTIRSNSFGTTVPEIKPGILIKTTMNVKKFMLPGSSPAVQSLGIGQTMLQLVGLFIGTEGTTLIENFNSVLIGKNPREREAIRLNSYQSALYFDTYVVQSSRPVDLLIRGDKTTDQFQESFQIELNYTGVIQDFRTFVTRSDRTYYAIDFLVTNYRSKS
jgi:hypothetical protein